jgi:hypothetical protein
MRYSVDGGAAGWVRLALAQVVAMGFSPSGLIVAPLTAGLVLVGSWQPDRRATRLLFTGLAASAVVTVQAVVATLQVREFGEIVSPLDATSTAKALDLVLGHGWRAGLALFGLLGAVALSRHSPRRRGTVGYLTAAFLLLLSPWAGALISRAEPTFAWRALWAVPFPLVLGAMCAQLASRGPRIAGVRVGTVGVLIFALLFAFVPGRSTWAAENKARIKLSVLRVAEGFPAAERVVEVTRHDGLVLAPRRVATWITGMRGHPRLVGVRQDYLDIVVGKALGPDEARQRYLLMRFVQGKLGTDRTLSVADEIERREIDTVVTGPDLTAVGGQEFFDELARRGYDREDAAGGYILWTR